MDNHQRAVRKAYGWIETDSGEWLRPCHGCGRHLPESAFYTYPSGQPHWRCKTCFNRDNGARTKTIGGLTRDLRVRKVT